MCSLKCKFINMKIRLNPYTIAAIISAICTAVRISPSNLTSWTILISEVQELFGNPFLLVTTVCTVFGIIHDPTTKGLSDSSAVLQMDKPSSDKDKISA